MPTDEIPTMAWLRLTPPQARMFLVAWGADSVICRGRELNVAHRLKQRGLFDFVGPIDGGLRGEFRLTAVARGYPPTGLKSLVARQGGRIEITGGQRHAD